MKRMIALLLLLCMLTACVAPVPETEEPTAASQEIAVPEQKQPDSGTMTGAATFTQAASGPLTYTVVLKTLEDSAAAADGTPDTPPVFRAKAGLSENRPLGFTLKEARAMDGGSLWLRYTVTA